MSSLNDLRQRLEDEYLEPVTEETPQAPITGNLNTTDTTFSILDGVLSPDEESYYAPGRVVELNNEAMRVEAYDESTKTFTVKRNVRGTQAQEHEAGDSLRIPTRWLRKSQLEALRDSIDSLWQPLYATHEVRATIDSAGYVSLPTTTVRILAVEYETRQGRWRTAESRLFATHPLDEEQAAVQIARGPNPTALCVVKYGTRIVAPTLDSDDIDHLPSKWERIVLADAAANLMIGVDVDAVSQEVLTEKIRLEGFPVRSGASISQSLIQYREYLVGRANAELVAMHKRPIVHLQATAMRTS
jgi:hypothetical protein